MRAILNWWKQLFKNDDSDASSDDDFLVQATEHMRIKKVDRVTKDDTDLSDNIKSLEARIRRLEKDFNEAKNSQYSDSKETKIEISAFAGFNREPEMHKVNKQWKSIEKTLCNLESVDDIDIYLTPAEIQEIFQYQQRNLKDLESKKSFTKVQRDKVLTDQKKIYPQKETKEKKSDATRNRVATQYQLKPNLEVSRKLHAQLDKELRQNERQKEWRKEEEKIRKNGTVTDQPNIGDNKTKFYHILGQCLNIYKMHFCFVYSVDVF